MESLILQVILLLAISLNLYVTILIYKLAHLQRSQKVKQLFILWIIPLLAGIWIWLLHKESTLEQQISQ